MWYGTGGGRTRLFRVTGECFHQLNYSTRRHEPDLHLRLAEFNCQSCKEIYYSYKIPLHSQLSAALLAELSCQNCSFER